MLVGVHWLALPLASLLLPTTLASGLSLASMCLPPLFVRHLISSCPEVLGVNASVAGGILLASVAVIAAALIVIVLCLRSQRDRMTELVNTPIHKFGKRPKFEYTGYKATESSSSLTAMRSASKRVEDTSVRNSNPVPGSVIAAFDESIFANQTTTRINPVFDADAIMAVFDDDNSVEIQDLGNDVVVVDLSARDSIADFGTRDTDFSEGAQMETKPIVAHQEFAAFGVRDEDFGEDDDVNNGYVRVDATATAPAPGDQLDSPLDYLMSGQIEEPSPFGQPEEDFGSPAKSHVQHESSQQDHSTEAPHSYHDAPQEEEVAHGEEVPEVHEVLLSIPAHFPNHYNTRLSTISEEGTIIDTSSTRASMAADELLEHEHYRESRIEAIHEDDEDQDISSRHDHHHDHYNAAVDPEEQHISDVTIAVHEPENEPVSEPDHSVTTHATEEESSSSYPIVQMRRNEDQAPAREEPRRWSSEEEFGFPEPPPLPTLSDLYRRKSSEVFSADPFAEVRAQVASETDVEQHKDTPALHGASDAVRQVHLSFNEQLKQKLAARLHANEPEAQHSVVDVVQEEQPQEQTEEDRIIAEQRERQKSIGRELLAEIHHAEDARHDVAASQKIAWAIAVRMHALGDTATDPHEHAEVPVAAKTGSLLKNARMDPNLLVIDDLPQQQRDSLAADVAQSFATFVEQMNESAVDDRLGYVDELHDKLKETPALIHELVDLGGVATVAEYLKDESNVPLQNAASRVLALIASIEAGATAIAHSGCIGILVQYCTQTSLIENVLRTLQSIGSCSPQMNRLVLDSDVVVALCSAIDKGELARYDVPFAVDFIDALCGDARLDSSWEQTSPSVATLIGLLAPSNPQVATRAAECLFSVCQRFSEAASTMFAANFVDVVQEALRSSPEDLTVAVLLLVSVTVPKLGEFQQHSITQSNALLHLILATMTSDSAKVVVTAIQCIESLIRCDKAIVETINRSSEAEGLLQLQFHASEDVRTLALELMASYGIGNM